MQKDFEYKGRGRDTLSFPLGGIGTGSIGLTGNGHLEDWEIYNRPNKKSVNGFTHMAIRAEAEGRVLDARALQGPVPLPYTGENLDNIGFGPRRQTMGGVPCFSGNVFRAGYPLAHIDFTEEKFPGQVTLTGFNPLIPLEDRDSSFPAAFFEIAVTNPTDMALTYTVAFTLANPHREAHEHTLEGGSLLVGQQGRPMTEPEHGELAVVTDAAVTGGQQYWYRGAWFDGLTMFWRDFTAPGALRPRSYPSGGSGEDCGVLTASAQARPGETVRLRFVLAWYYPNQNHYWGMDPAKHTQWRNYYATQWEGAMAVAREGLERFDELLSRTRRFHDVLFSSTVPREVLDAVSANLSILKSATVLRLEDGSFYGWEGCASHAGSCEGSCTHVWNYAYALPYLFPALERSMRELDYTYNLREDGGMPFRLQLPLGSPYSSFRPCVDGQMGGVMKVYRDWKISGDTRWLREWWPRVKRSLLFAWSPENPDRWDPEQSGIMTGRQHHTLDMELFGPNSWLTGFYLGALKAAEAMARALGDEDAELFARIFARGKSRADRELFNGEYYVQRVDMTDRSLLERFDREGDTPSVTYWNGETGEMKYQIGEGCAIDQVLAQWHANLMGLGEIFDPGQTRSALESIYKYNYKDRLGDVFNPCRLYGLADESGTQICSYPEGKPKPAIAVPYAEETMHGFEYQFAVHMMQMGMVEQGVTVFRSVRSRYDGERRNPFNEMECGSNYARSMASFAALPALSGFSFDMTRGAMGFAPLLEGEFSTLWSLGPAWGSFACGQQGSSLTVEGGSLSLRELSVPGSVRSVSLNGTPVPFTVQEGRIALSVQLEAGDNLKIL